MKSVILSILLIGLWAWVSATASIDTNNKCTYMGYHSGSTSMLGTSNCYILVSKQPEIFQSIRLDLAIVSYVARGKK